MGVPLVLCAAASRVNPWCGRLTVVPACGSPRTDLAITASGTLVARGQQSLSVSGTRVALSGEEGVTLTSGGDLTVGAGADVSVLARSLLLQANDDLRLAVTGYEAPLAMHGGVTASVESLGATGGVNIISHGS